MFPCLSKSTNNRSASRSFSSCDISSNGSAVTGSESSVWPVIGLIGFPDDDDAAAAASVGSKEDTGTALL